MSFGDVQKVYKTSFDYVCNTHAEICMYFYICVCIRSGGHGGDTNTYNVLGSVRVGYNYNQLKANFFFFFLQT